uniref:Uncharacterized protein n=1 Tax=Nothoprocta perdicaria TaxID=30464 RepID=A0A8C6YTT8_NOTPE
RGGAMAGGAPLPALLLAPRPPGLCVAFNVDVSSPRLLRGPPEAQFGYKVLQRRKPKPGWELLVGAPWDGPDGDRRGAVYKCPVGPPNSTCTQVDLGEAPGGNMHLGMTLLHGPGGGFVACAPLWSQECGTSVFSSGICTRMDSELRPVETLANCRRGGADAVCLRARLCFRAGTRARGPRDGDIGESRRLRHCGVPGASPSTPGCP